MEVRPGYKQTEVGILPEDWGVRPCSELSERIMVGIVIRPAQYYVRYGVPALRSANIREGGITDIDLVFISEASNALLGKSQTRVGDVLTVRTGYPGTSAVVRPVHAGCNCIDILITRPSGKHDPDYLAIWVNSSFGKEQVLRNQGGLAQKHFNVGDMRNLVVALPPLPEQRAIATALGDVDALIRTLDQLIAKKRDLKQAAMQQLLTGRTRLPTFRGDWEVRKLGSVLCYEQPTDYLVESSDYDDNYDVAVLTANKSFVLGYTDEHYGVCETLPVVIFDDFTTATKYVDFPFKVKSSALKILRLRDGRDDLRYLFWRMQLIRFPLGDHKRYWISEYQNIEIPVPSPAEQSAITAVLVDMDAEITALEARRDKTRALKQGMMQELLTGRTRLV